MVRAPLGNSKQTMARKKKNNSSFFQSGNKNEKLNVHTCMRFPRISYAKLLKFFFTSTDACAWKTSFS